MTDARQIAERLTKAQREIMAGHLVDIPPEEADQLKELGLKGEEYWHEEEWGRRMIWPILTHGLAVRAHLPAQPDEGLALAAAAIRAQEI